MQELMFNAAEGGTLQWWQREYFERLYEIRQERAMDKIQVRSVRGAAFDCIRPLTPNPTQRCRMGAKPWLTRRIGR